jgi:radical SAM superfamily enzyme YgiQ (UPF0313 family)
MASLTPSEVDGCPVEIHTIDEYVQTDRKYLDLLHRDSGCRTLLALVGVQSHQMHRALDLAAYARRHGCGLSVLGGPHPMICDTALLRESGVSVALSEAELVWRQIVADAVRQGELAAAYGGERRWQQELPPVVLEPPTRRDLQRYVIPIVGLYPARGCPYRCSFCLIYKLAGHQVRTHPVEATLASLRAAKKAGVRYIFFTSDNFNKYPDVSELLEGMIREGLRLPFFVQCDAQVAEQEDLIEQLARAGCFQMFLGVETFDRESLRGVRKHHNQPPKYPRILELCRRTGITSHFSNIIGFPGQTEDGIREDVEALRTLRPDMASFYILCPVPGSDQYGEFLTEGLLEEKNLDRFDGTHLNWRHPSLDAKQLSDLLYRCYREFYAGAEFARRVRRWSPRLLDASGRILLSGFLFWGWSGRRRHHPMAGGVGLRRLDGVPDYIDLRRSTYGLELLPLPHNLELSEHDDKLNRHAKLALPHR